MDLVRCYGGHVCIRNLLDLRVVQGGSLTEGRECPVLPCMLWHGLLPHYLAEALSILLVLLILHLQLMNLKPWLPTTRNTYDVSPPLQIKYLLCNLEVFSLDPLCLQFPSPHMKAL